LRLLCLIVTAETASSVRADKWLWAARFYKTRSLAMQAINGGKVHVNGERVKPARRLVTGDRLTVQKGPCRFVITVERLSLQRGPAEQAHELYSESEQSRQERQALSMERRLQGHVPGRHERRPDKHTRRQLRELKR
jgi:ribosome-associated heat shock protein Hsp15